MITINRMSVTYFIFISASIAIFLVNGVAIQSVIDDIIDPKNFGDSAIFSGFLLENTSLRQKLFFYASCFLSGMIVSVVLQLRLGIFRRALLSVFVIAFILSINDATLLRDIDVEWILTFIAYNIFGASVVVALILICISASFDLFDANGRSSVALAFSIVSWIVVSSAIMFWIDPYPVSVSGEFSGKLSTNTILDPKTTLSEITTEGADAFETSAGKVDWSVSSSHPSILMDVAIYKTSNCFPRDLTVRVTSSTPDVKLKNVKNFSISSTAVSSYTAITAEQSQYSSKDVFVEIKWLERDKRGGSIAQFVPEGQTTSFKSDGDFRLLFTAVSLEDSTGGASRITSPIVTVVSDGSMRNFVFDPKSDRENETEGLCKVGKKYDPTSILPGLLVVAKPSYSNDNLIIRYPFVSDLKSTGHFLRAIRMDSDENAAMRREKALVFNTTYEKATISIHDKDFSLSEGEAIIHGNLEVEWLNDKVKVSGVTRGVAINGKIYRWSRWDLLTDTTKVAWLSALGALFAGVVGALRLLRFRIASGFRKM